MFTRRLFQVVAVLVLCLSQAPIQAAMRDLFVTDFTEDIIRRYDGETGAFINNFSFLIPLLSRTSDKTGGRARCKGGCGSSGVGCGEGD